MLRSGLSLLKKCSKVDLGLMAALALSLTGCNSNQMQRCVDDGNVVSADQFCSPGPAARYHWGTDATGPRRCLDANIMAVKRSRLAAVETMGLGGTLVTASLGDARAQ